MKTELSDLTVRDLIEGYHDDCEGGVIGIPVVEADRITHWSQDNCQLLCRTCNREKSAN